MRGVVGRCGQRPWPGLLALCAVLLLAMTDTAKACAVPADAPALREAMNHLLNAERTAAGLARLRMSHRITGAAQSHACSIARRDDVSHRGALGGGLRLRLLRRGYSPGGAAENLAMGLDTAPGVVVRWMASPAHRANVLARGMRDIGIGVARGANGQLYWVAISAHR